MSELITTTDQGSTARPMPLKGIRIADFTAVIAGPYCTYQLALLGADVIKVERPGTGDQTRRRADLAGIPGLTAEFVAQNAAKRSIQIDLHKPQGVALARKLVSSCDVMLENYTPGVAERIGLGYEAMKALNPKMIYASLSGYGQDGPFSRRPAYDHVIQGASGITMITGTPETVPNRMGPPMFDYIAGIYGAFAILAAIKECDRTGLGQHLDVAMLDAALVSMASFSSRHLNGGKDVVANGNTAGSGSPASGIFPTREGMIAVAANNERQVRQFCGALGEPNLLEDARFSTTHEREKHAKLFGQAIIERLATRSAAEWEDAMAKAHVPAARVRTLNEVLHEPQVIARGVQQEMIDPQSGKSVFVPTIGFKWNGQPLGPERMPPRLGADADSVLAAIGLDESEIAELRNEGVVLQPPVA